MKDYDQKIDDAAHAAMKALGLDADDHPDALDLMADAIRTVADEFDLEEEIMA